MNPRGYEILIAVLEAYPETQGATVTPQPKPGENIKEIAIHRKEMERQTILRVLGEAGLMSMSKPRHTDPDAPRFGWGGDATRGQRNELGFKFIDRKDYKTKS